MVKKTLRTLKCAHYSGNGYGYTLNKKETISLCAECHLNLASEIMKQMATEVFIRTMEK